MLHRMRFGSRENSKTKDETSCGKLCVRVMRKLVKAASAPLPRPTYVESWSDKSGREIRVLGDRPTTKTNEGDKQDSLKVLKSDGSSSVGLGGNKQDDSLFQLRALWDLDGGEKSRSRLFCSLVNIENDYD